MARNIIDRAIGYIPIPQSLSLVDDEGDPISGDAGSGKLTIDAIKYLHGLLLSIGRAINGRLSFGDGTPASKSGNIDGQWVPVLTPVAANTEFAVAHGLGRIPTAILVALSDTHSTIVVSSLGSWTEDRVYLKCSAGGVTLRLLLL